MEEALDELNTIMSLSGYSTCKALQKWKEDYIQEVHSSVGIPAYLEDKIPEGEIRKMLAGQLGRELAKYLPLIDGRPIRGTMDWEHIYRMSTFVLIDKSKLPENK